MTKMNYLKDSYKTRLYVVAAINVALFWALVILHADLSMLWALLNSISLKDGIIGMITPIGAFVLDGLLSADTKARIVYWRYTHPLPGSRAFSVHLKQEPRADPERLLQQWGVFSDDPVEQNRLWYRIFGSVEQDIRVHEAHREWLFSRDLTAYTVLFLVAFGTATLVSGRLGPMGWWYLIGLATQYLAVMTAARNYGIRFVRTVLAVASQRDQEIRYATR